MGARHSFAALAMVLLMPAAVLPAWAQDGAGSGGGTTTLLGAFTESQAQKGAAAYRKYCMECHVPAVHTGTAFQRAWAGRTAYDFFEAIRTRMPNDTPGRLSRGQYADIVAYVFKLNGLPPGEKPLPSGEDALKLIRIEIKPPAQQNPSP